MINNHHEARQPKHCDSTDAWCHMQINGGVEDDYQLPR
jgi:hypothetical protein